MSRDFVTLSKIRKKGDTSVLKLKCEWYADELNILIIDGDTAWNGRFSAEDIEKVCEKLGVKRDDYIAECQEALSARDEEGKFSFTVENNEFVWRKELERDIVVKCGSIKLSSVSFVETLQQFLECAFDTIKQYCGEVLDAKRRTEYFETERTILISKLEEYEKKKEEIENILYSKFLSVLNAKKERIAALEQEISDLASKIKNSATETTNNGCEKRVETEEKLKVQSSIKETRKTRRTNKKPYQHSTRQSLHSLSVAPEQQVLSENNTDNSNNGTDHSSGGEVLGHKKNVRTKALEKTKRHDIAESTASLVRKEETTQNTLKLVFDLVSESDVIEASASVPVNMACESNIDKQENKDTSCALSLAPSTTLTESSEECSTIKNGSADHFTMGKHSTSIPIPDEKLSQLNKRLDTAHGPKRTADAVSLCESQARSKARRIREVICPTDLLSGKVNIQSNVRQNIMNKTEFSKENRKVLTSPAKQQRDGETICPLDKLTSAASSKSDVVPVVNREQLFVLNRNHRESIVRSLNTQEGNNSELAADGVKINITHTYSELCSEEASRNKSNIGTNYVNRKHKTNNVESQIGVENKHYDSETDVDEPEDSCILSDRSVNDIQRNNIPVDPLLTMSNSPDLKCSNTHSQEQKNIFKKLLNDSQDTNNCSIEATVALPKRVRRSERISKYVPIDSKSINHFTELGQLQKKEQDLSCDQQVALYEQETQLVDTQKLLDEM